jgi:ABC-type Fe3+ transport system permease subunit
MRRISGGLLIGAGLAGVVLGFLYGLFFAGLPYQDPTPEMQARWKFHDAVSDAILLAGLALVVAGALVMVAGWLRRLTKRG